MHNALLTLLRCPLCSASKLQASITRSRGMHILEGELQCPGCGTTYPILEGIPDMLPPLDRDSHLHRSWTQGGQWLMEQRWFSRLYERVLRPILIGALAGSPSWLTQEGEFLMDLPAIGPDEVVLDVGCGPGRFTRLLADHTQARHVIGVDLSRPMLIQNTRRNEEERLSDRISLVRADVDHLPFTDRAFGAVNCFTAFHLFPDLDRAVSEMARVLRAGHRLTIMALVRPDARWGAALAYLSQRLSHMTLMSVEDIRRVLWRHRIATMQEEQHGLAVLISAVVAEPSRRSMALEG